MRKPIFRWDFLNKLSISVITNSNPAIRTIDLSHNIIEDKGGYSQSLLEASINCPLATASDLATNLVVIESTTPPRVIQLIQFLSHFLLTIVSATPQH